MDRTRPRERSATPRKTGRIVVRGEFGPLLAAALPDCEVDVGSGETRITARVRDESELLGLLERVRNFGAPLVSVTLEP